MDDAYVSVSEMKGVTTGFVMYLLMCTLNAPAVHAEEKLTLTSTEQNMLNKTYTEMEDATIEDRNSSKDEVGQTTIYSKNYVYFMHENETTELQPRTDLTDEKNEDTNEVTTVKSTEHLITDSKGCHELEIFENCFVGVFAISGIIGNSLSIRILQRIKTNISSSLLLSVLAFWDSAFLVCIIVMKPLISILSYFTYVPTVQHFVVYLFAYGFETLEVTLRQSTWATALVTLHRYIGSIRM